MSVQIIIDGDHATDVMGELVALAKGLMPTPIIAGDIPKDVVEKFKTEPGRIVIEEEPCKEVEEEVKDQPRKLSRGEHRIEADRMISRGEIDDEIFPLLSKNQQDRVVKELEKQEEKAEKEEQKAEKKAAKQAEKENKEKNLFDDDGPVEAVEAKGGEIVDDDPLGLFDDEDKQPEVTLADLRKLISKTCVDEDKNDIPEAYAAVRKLLRSVIPEGKDIKTSNIPEDKIASLYKAISEI